ncbi:MAG: hypothetical protein HRU38_24310 [Saccharospirillaceae bacterium]|nr:hypothetical protein [Pseudomonadales bacterium]NRB81745.1 hypothetical protein [Saccharospirillaceae bacterium]
MDKSDTKKDKDFTKEIHLATAAELERFGFANAQHILSISELDKIASSKINPEYKNTNTIQQAGFSAEVKHTARTNADNIIAGKSERIARTDDVGSVNHQNFDHVAVDTNGQPLLNSDGSFQTGTQQKCFSKVENYSKLLTDKQFEKYKSGDINVPSDQLPEIKKDWENKVTKLKEQEQTLKANGDDQGAVNKRKQIEKIEDAKSRLKDSGVTFDESIEARTSPKLSVIKDIAKVSHKAGIESAKMGGTIGGTLSAVKNTYAYLNGDKKGSDALLDISKDTGKAVAVAYASGATTSVIGGALSSSGNQIAKNLAKGNTPALLLQAGVALGKNTSLLLSGKMTANEFAHSMTKESMTIATSLVGANYGALVGTMILPGVGTVVGGVVGGIAASMVSSSLYNELKTMMNAVDLSNARRAEMARICEHLITEEKKNRIAMLQTFDHFFEDKENELHSGFESIALSIQNGERMDKGLDILSSSFKAEIKFKSLSEFDQVLESDKGFTI